MKTKVLVLGGSGMLGSMVANHLSQEPEFDVTGTARTQEAVADCAKRIPGVEWSRFDASATEYAVPEIFKEADWVINCIGIIKPLIHDDNAEEVERAIQVNALFPHRLAGWTEGKASVLQIATDCVYSGASGNYTEDAPHDALDVYGKTKSVGEAYASHLHHLRCSIIGPEMKAPKSLLEWFLNQAQGALLKGFTNHNWNGITTLHFAKLCKGIIQRDIKLPHSQHVVPHGHVTKCEMLEHFARCYHREDVTITPTEAATIIDRTLSTKQEDLNRELWLAAGYAQFPTVPLMIEELAGFDHRSVKGVYA